MFAGATERETSHPDTLVFLGRSHEATLCLEETAPAFLQIRSSGMMEGNTRSRCDHQGVRAQLIETKPCSERADWAALQATVPVRLFFSAFKSRRLDPKPSKQPEKAITAECTALLLPA